MALKIHRSRKQSYAFLFLEFVDALAVASATSSLFGIPRDRIEVTSQGVVQSPAAGMPVVLVEYEPSRDGEYASFSAGDEFAHITGNLALSSVASRLCAALKVNAILGASNAASEAVWVLVTPEGGSGLVLVDTADLDEARYTITGKLQDFPGSPDVPLMELPDGFNPFYA